MPVTLLYRDNNGTDGTNDALCSLVYELNKKQYRIPADTSEPNRIPAVEALAGADQTALSDMIGTFVVSADAIEYFNTLQQEIRNVSNNNSIVIGTVFPAMRTLLQDDGTTGLYERYLNILRVSTGINQATFEGSPTTAQQHNAFTIAQSFANTGMIQMIAGVLFG